MQDYANRQTPKLFLSGCRNPVKQKVPGWNDPKWLHTAWWGELRLSVNLKSGLHVGSQQMELVSDGRKLLKILARGADSCPCIPGTSWKGAMRSLAELLSPSAFLGESPAPKTRGSNLPETDWANSLFGFLGYRGRISFSDSVFSDKKEEKTFMLGEGQVARQFQPRINREGKLKTYPGNPDWATGGTKQTVEMVFPSGRKGRLPRLVVMLDGLWDWEVGWLLTVLGQHPKYMFTHQIGYGRNQGFGRVRLLLKTMKLQQGRAGLGTVAKANLDDGQAMHDLATRFTDQYFGELKACSPNDEELERVKDSLVQLQGLDRLGGNGGGRS